MFIANFFKFRNYLNNSQGGSYVDYRDNLYSTTDIKDINNTNIKVVTTTCHYSSHPEYLTGSWNACTKLLLNYSKILYAPTIKLSTTNIVNFNDYEIDNIDSDVVVSNLVYNSTLENDKTIVTINCTITNNGADTTLYKAGIYSKVEYFDTMEDAVSRSYIPSSQTMLIAEHVFDSPIALLANESKSLTIQLVLAGN